MSEELRWYEKEGKGLPAWARSAALAADGTIFVPAALGGEMDALLSAAYDGVPIVQYRDHAFVPSEWLKTEYPKTAEVVSKIENGVRDFFK